MYGSVAERTESAVGKWFSSCWEFDIFERKSSISEIYDSVRTEDMVNV